MKSKIVWFVGLVIVLAGSGFYFRDSLASLTGLAEAQPAAQAQGRRNGAAAEPATTTIRPAADARQVSAAGNIAIVSEQSAVLQADGMIAAVMVEVGDQVAAGDFLVVLDTTDLERAIQRAELAVAVRQTQLDLLSIPSQPADIAAAQADLVSAQEDLAELQVEPKATELALAQAKLDSANERYREILTGKSEAELTQLSVDLLKKSNALRIAQEAYDAISYRGDIGSTSQAITLQEATIDYDAAKAAYEIAIEPPSEADLKEAEATIKDAEHQLATLRQPASQAELAAAEAQIANVEARLTELLNGPSEVDLREAQLNLEQAYIDIEEAEAKLAHSRLRAPAAGTILTVITNAGQQGSVGMPIITLADLTALELTVNVAEVDISKVKVDQPATIAVDALPDEQFSGVVSRIAPTSASEGGVVNYGVTIRLDNLEFGAILPGMTAVATIHDGSQDVGWLVPTNALREGDGDASIVVIRDGQRTRLNVTRGPSQGEWTVVQSADLQSDDEVVGQVSSFVGQEDTSAPRGLFGGRPGGGGGGRP